MSLTPLYNVSAVTGDFDGDAAGTVNAGATLSTNRLGNGSLSALVTVDAETNTITLAAKWQVSTDKSTWVDLVAANNPANVVLATGTASADAAVTKAIACPNEAYGWRYVRCVVVSGVATGAATDTYAIGYCYRNVSGF